MLQSMSIYSVSSYYIYISVFFFNDTATTEIYTLSLHDALPIYRRGSARVSTRERHGGAPGRFRGRWPVSARHRDHDHGEREQNGAVHDSPPRQGPMGGNRTGASPSSAKRLGTGRGDRVSSRDSHP